MALACCVHKSFPPPPDDVCPLVVLAWNMALAADMELTVPAAFAGPVDFSSSRRRNDLKEQSRVGQVGEQGWVKAMGRPWGGVGIDYSRAGGGGGSARMSIPSLRLLAQTVTLLLAFAELPRVAHVFVFILSAIHSER